MESEVDGSSEPNTLSNKRLSGYRLTTALITYHLPDYPRLLQEFVWQDLDLAPWFPELSGFLSFWERRIEGRLHSVEVATSALIRPSRFRFTDGLLELH